MSIESTNETISTSTENTSSEPESLVDAIFDAALGWVDIGLETARATLAQSAKTLQSTAKVIDGVREKLRS